MGGYTLSKAAEEDLTAIALYTVQNFGVDQARVYRDSLLKSCSFLAEHPEASRLRTELDPPMRAHRHQSHIIFYKIDDNNREILIVRVRHAQEDWLPGPVN